MNSEDFKNLQIVQEWLNKGDFKITKHVLLKIIIGTHQGVSVDQKSAVSKKLGGKNLCHPPVNVYIPNIYEESFFIKLAKEDNLMSMIPYKYS